MKPLAYAKDVAARRRNNERVGLLVVSVHDWSAGKWFEGRLEVSRVVLPDDLPVEAADWSVCLALDVVLCGNCADELFKAAVRAVMAAGAASVWAEYAEGVACVEAVGARGVVAVSEPVPVEKLGAMLRRQREAALALRMGGYASRFFDAAREALFGPTLIEMKSSLAEAER